MAHRKPSKTEQKYRKFAAEYLIDENGRRAYKATYGPHVKDSSADVGASKLLRNPKVKVIIDALMAETLKRLDVDRDYVIHGIKDTVERCRALTPVLDKKSGKPVVIGAHTTEDGKTVQVVQQCAFDPFGALKGFELLGKHLKLFTEKVEVNDPTKMTPEQRNEEMQRIITTAKMRETIN